MSTNIELDNIEADNIDTDNIEMDNIKMDNKSRWKWLVEWTIRVS